MTNTLILCTSCNDTKCFSPEEIAGFHKLQGIPFTQVVETYTCQNCKQNRRQNSKTGDKRGLKPKVKPKQNPKPKDFSTQLQNQVFQPNSQPDLFGQCLIDKLGWLNAKTGGANKYPEYLKVSDAQTREVLIIDPRFFAQAAMTFEVLDKFEGKHSADSDIEPTASKFLPGLDLQQLLMEALVWRIRECKIVKTTSSDDFQRITFPSFSVQIGMGRVIGYDSNQTSRPAQILHVLVNMKGRYFRRIQLKTLDNHTK